MMLIMWISSQIDQSRNIKNKKKIEKKEKEEPLVVVVVSCDS